MSDRPGEGFGQLVRERRQAAGMTQQELADRSGLSVRGISDVERGLKRNPRPFTVRMLADALELGAEERAAFFVAAGARPVAPGFTLGRVSPRVGARPALPQAEEPPIGREAELAEIAQLLDGRQARVVTVAGAAGAGRTRLALEAARRAAPRFRDGVAYAPMAAARDAGQAPAEIGFAFGLRALDVPDPLESLGGALQGMEALLVLDDPDAALETGFDLGGLLDRCPGLTVLATANAALGVAGERAVAAGPLAAPGADDPAPERWPAVRLYLARSGGWDRAAAAEAVRAVGGMPLAIELAARAGDRADAVADAVAVAMAADAAEGDAAAMRRATAWSVGRLTAPERRLLERLAVFRGGFTLEAAHAAAGDAGTRPGRTLELVESLLAAGLLTARSGPGGPRFDLPAPVAEAAAAGLANGGEERAARDRHLAWIISAAGRLEERIFFPLAADDPGQELFDAELGNVRAGLEWAAASRNHAEGLELIGAAWFPLSLRGLSREGFGWARRFAPEQVARLGRTAFAPLGLLGAGWIGALAGEAAAGEALARQGLANALAVEPDLAPLAMTVVSFCLSAQRMRTEAIEAATEAARLAAGPPASRWSGLAANRLGVARENDGDAAGAIAPFEDALATWRRHCFRWGMATARNNLTDALFQIGAWDRAGALHREVIAEDLAGFPAADPWAVLRSWQGLAEIAAAAGDHRRAATLFGAGERYREERGLLLPLDERAARAAVERQLRAGAGPGAVAGWLAEGRMLTPREALALSAEA